jgi:antitoxin PrlF
MLDVVRSIPYHKFYMRRSAMPTIHEVATITSKGQITLPKPIRQALGVDYGGKVAFDLRGSQVIVSRADEASHEDPAIASFLALLEKDIRTGQHLCNLPAGLVQAMQAAAQNAAERPSRSPTPASPSHAQTFEPRADRRLRARRLCFSD